ncbi:divalent-cation tolerance protein CutA [Colwelliaceae bacterium 6471]
MYQLILCTCPSKIIASEIANYLVTNKLAACVNILPGIESIYCWQEKVESSNEVQLLIKTQAEKFQQLAKAINKLHPYDVPEIIALNIQQGDKHYLNWITESLK